MNAAHLLNWTLLIPLLAVVGIVLCSRWENLRETASLGAAAILFAVVCTLYGNLRDGVELAVHWIEILPGLAISFRVDTMGMVFALIASSLWFVTVLYAIGYMRGHDEQNQTRFYACFAVAISAVMGIAFAENLFTLFVFYEVLSLCTYPLVTHAGNEKAKNGGRIYLGILLGTSIALFLPAIIGTWMLSGTLDFTPGGVFPEGTSPVLLSVLLVLFAFGIGKAALMPFHRWLPAAMVAPTPVSALLHAVAVVKAGVFSVVKVVVFIFGIDTVADLPVTSWLVYLAGASILLASLVAMRQDNFKSRLAYSTVSQLGYITLGAFMASQAAIVGSMLHITMHAFGKITLFFCAGAVYVAHHKSEISQLDGMGRVMPVTFIAFTLGALSIIGLPPLGGVWSKWFLMMGALDSGYLIMLAVLSISSLLNIVYLLEIPARAFLRPAPAGASLQEARPSSVVAMVITTLMCIALFIYGSDLYEFIRSARLV
ncbi:MAG: proton-conducting transporter membrane subunit [Spongiibacter sp.]|uniref:Monovalent cation/H+ antiporter subunit D family protein n=1 Tax=Spongiibacter thalassae TaxID=2721624 RepID=A0ABX1GCK2_9GAMM|nr:proton-conducting transporter membrane subunit [Spongiibacter thalassae]MDX1504299.1 proton-conducting transporter membrane subunit [Spongiibacter sp.]NKI16218.1 monovalent cation/H+ antiporter subunit D family protein [Spongiibacter thalassae]